MFRRAREGSAQGSLVRRLLVFYVLTRAGLYALVGASFVWPENGGPLRSIRIYPLSSVAAANPAALRPFANWDADHYIQIAGAGYSGRLPAFFPLFPALMRIVALGRPDWMIAAGLVINVVAGCVAAVLLLKLIHIDHPQAAWPATVLILSFPGAVFLSLPYTEALELLFLVLAAYLARRRRWWLAGAAGALAALTRPPGVVVIVLLALEYALQQPRPRLRDLPALLLPLAGSAAFILYLWLVFGDPLAFVNAQSATGRSMGIVPVEVGQGRLFRSPSVWLWAAALVLAIMAIFKLRRSYGVFAAALLLTAPLTGMFGSSARWILITWPVFALAGQLLEREHILLTVACSFSLGLAFFALLFTHGYWVA